MKGRIEEGHFLVARPIAHRGLHGNGVPENSAAAYIKAIEAGYPIEMDVQLTKDLQVVCFHDDDLKRMTGVDSLIYDKTYAELKELRLAGTEERIMLFSEFLELVGGKVPLVIEYKRQRVKKTIVDKTLPLLDAYKGEFVVQSFDPTIVMEFKKKRPEWIRGQLISRDRHENLSRLTDKLLAKGFFNFLSKPDFINMQIDYLPCEKRLYKNRKLISWTIKTEEQRERAKEFADNYIFENIRP